MKILTYLLMICLIGSFNFLNSYRLPVAIDLGATNILDGGPKVESPGIYWIQYQVNYYARTFLDSCGNLLGGVKSPKLDIFAIYTELLYQSRFKICGGAPGIGFQLPPFTVINTSCNTLGLESVDAGLSNPILDLFFQWDMINYKNRPLFIHRITTEIILPWGTNKYPQKTINPADIMTCIDSCWAASFYFTEHWAVSWHLYYLWCGENKKTKIQPGQAFHMNYSMEYEVYKECWVAINGYYLQQTTFDKQCGIDLPDSKERVVAAGPGFACFLPQDYVLLGHLYFETKARNRTQGILAYLDLIKRF